MDPVSALAPASGGARSDSRRSECVYTVCWWLLSGGGWIAVLLGWHQHARPLSAERFFALLVGGVVGLELARIYVYHAPGRKYRLWLHPDESWQYYALFWPANAAGLLVGWQLLFPATVLPACPATLAGAIALIGEVFFQALVYLLLPLGLMLWQDTAAGIAHRGGAALH